MSSTETKADARQRKTGISRGTRTQRAMTFRLDEDLQEWLDTKPNKGRTINDCLRGRMKFETTME